MVPNYKISGIHVPIHHRQVMAIALFVRTTTFYHGTPSNLTVPPEASTSTLPRKILIIHGALTMVLPYIHTRLRRHALSKAWPDAPSSDRRRKAWELMTKLETTHAAIALASFVVFLWDGQ